ncbi:MAG: outer membrane lipoprotein-sorting protein [Candidatus Latescibacteria bacterium]|nr:outer membrane lipoprotein-sorting protein [Candidatus Latescibacterota bacterium]
MNPALPLPLLALLLVFAPSPVRSNPPSPEPTVAQLIAQADELYRSQTSHSRLEMDIETPHWQRRLVMEIWTRGMDETLIHIEAPKKDAGTATLRRQQAMWNYFPRIDKVMKVPPSMMMSAWMGSDFTNDDLVKETSLLEKYDAELLQPEGADPAFYYIDLVPKERTPTVWGRIRVVVRRTDLLPVREEFYDERGRQMRRMEFADVGNLGGRRVPTTITVRPLGKEGHSTTIRYLEAQFDLELAPDQFSLRNLRRR